MLTRLLKTAFRKYREQILFIQSKPSVTKMKIHNVPAVICIVAIILISGYSAFTIDRVIVSNALPTVVFTLGTVERDVTYGNSQTLDLYMP